MSDIYDAKTMRPDTSLGYLLAQVRIGLVNALDRELQALDMTAAQFTIMAHLVHHEADSASSLCKGLQYDPGAMTRMIDRLEAKGLLRRVRHPDDRRAARLELTSEGKALFPKVMEKAVNVLNRSLKGFTKPEARQLEGFLKRMLANI